MDSVSALEGLVLIDQTNISTNHLARIVPKINVKHNTCLLHWHIVRSVLMMTFMLIGCIYVKSGSCKLVSLGDT